jgi:DNA polymerase II large subunit
MAALTTVAAGVAIAGTVTSAGMSFSQASKQKKLQQQAERDADKAMAEARGKLDVNYAEQMSIKKEAYDAEREALLVQGAMATQAGVESERGSAASAGRVYAAQQAGQQQVRSAQADEMTNIENAIIEEDSRLRDLDVALDLEEVAGNQQKAADAQRAAEMAKQQGIESTISAVGQAAQMVPLYQQNMAAQKGAVSAIGNDPTKGGVDMAAFNKNSGLSDNMTDFSNVGNYSNKEFRQFKKALTPQQQNMLFQNQGYLNNYQNPMSVYLPQPTLTGTAK